MRYDFLDSNLDLEEKVLGEKKISELFTNDVMFEISDILILVVAEITSLDQEFYLSLYKKIKEANKKQNAKLVIVHNFSHIESELDLIKKVKSQIVGNGQFVTPKEFQHHKELGWLDTILKMIEK